MSLKSTTTICNVQSAFCNPKSAVKGQMAVEVIFVMPIFILLFFAIDFFGRYSLESERVNMASRYAVWKVRETDNFSLPSCYSGISVSVKPSGIRELLPSNIPQDESFFFALLHVLSNTVNDTKCIEVSSSVAVPREFGFGTIKEIKISETCVIDGSTWKISNITRLLRSVFKIPNIPYVDL